MLKLSRILLVLLSVIAVSCGRNTFHLLESDDALQPKGRAVYYWKSTFNLNDDEVSFISKHGIDKLYIRLFDVVVEGTEVVPIATTRFVSSVPDNIEIVPTVYITLSALKRYYSNEEELAQLIVTRVLNMCSYHDLGNIKEIQFDCDWTSLTRYSFDCLCEHAKELLHPQGIALSGTIRLHQIAEAEYPFDKGVVMLYNTGDFRNLSTENSILSYDDVEKYLGVKKRVRKFLEARKYNCETIDLAYPLFSWSTFFNKNGSFLCLNKRTDFSDIEGVERQDDATASSDNHFVVNKSCWIDDEFFSSGTTIRVEHSDIDIILRVKDLVDNTIGAAAQHNILYHLDSQTILNYSDNEIEKILR